TGTAPSPPPATPTASAALAWPSTCAWRRTCCCWRRRGWPSACSGSPQASRERERPEGSALRSLTLPARRAEGPLSREQPAAYLLAGDLLHAQAQRRRPHPQLALPRQVEHLVEGPQHQLREPLVHL